MASGAPERVSASAPLEDAHRHDHTRASLTIARKLARRSYHVLRELGPTAMEPVTAG